MQRILDNFASCEANAWAPGLKKPIVQLTEGAIGVGTILMGTFPVVGEVIYTIMEYNPPSMVIVHSDLPFARLSHKVVLTERRSWILVMSTCTGTYKGLYKLIAPILTWRLKKSFKANDLALKQYLTNQS